MNPRPRLAISLGDPRGIGPEVVAGALTLLQELNPVLVGYRGVDPLPPHLDLECVGEWVPGGGDRLAGELSGLAIERAVKLALTGEVDGVVTAPISKTALRAAGYRYPGHTEMLRDLTGVPDVTMMMAAERTPLGGPLRLALLTAHIPLRQVPVELTVELVTRRVRLAVDALRAWWGIRRPRVSFAGINPHASEGGLFGDEERLLLEPAIDVLTKDSDLQIVGIFPGDTVFLPAIHGEADLVVTPYHDVGLAVLKTLAREEGVNVTAGLPFPRTSPDHGTAMDIAGTGKADPGSMLSAIELCQRFCTTVNRAP